MAVDIRTKMRQEQRLAMMQKSSYSGPIGNSTGKQVLYCPTCKAPVVSSGIAWEQHLMRMPQCGRKR